MHEKSINNNLGLKNKLEILIYPEKLCYSGYKISVNYPLFLNIKFDTNKKYQYSWPTVELAKIKHA